MIPLLPAALKNLFKKPFTRKYPKEMVKAPKGFRGKISYIKMDCRGGGTCVRVCPANAITLIKKEKRVEIDLGKCIFCGECERVCPKNVLKLTREFEMAETHRNALIEY
jgi:formate hydrogenlyase subunit 6/NADH:ubiquinone oxidoreductase subunit I